MPLLDAVKASGGEFLSAALLGEGWEEALATVARAAEAQGAVLMRNRDHRLVAAISTKEIAEPVAIFMKGGAPSNSRQIRASHPLERGFRIDYDDYTDEELNRDPFYQEFLRPIGFFWHANVRLRSDSGEEVALSLKRAFKSGPYERQDALVLNSLLADLEAAVRISQRVLDAEAAGVVGMLHKRGNPVIELDAWGGVLRIHGDAGKAGVRVSRRRLMAEDRLAQAGLDRAIMTAVAPPRRAAVAPITEHCGERKLLQVVPLTGRARDVFLAASAVAVVIEPTPQRTLLRLEPDLIRDGFGLTDREAQVAALLAQGLSLAEIAEELSIGIGTIRNHLKSAFEKSGTTRQGEFVAVLGKLLP